MQVKKLVNNHSIPSTNAERKITNLLIDTVLLHIPLLALTDRQNYGGMNTLAARGLEELFSSCAVMSVFWFLVGNRFWCYLRI